MIILGISDVTGNHSNGSIALLDDNNLVFALSQERISRIKNDAQFPSDAIRTALKYLLYKLPKIDCFACAYPPACYYGSILAPGWMYLPRSVFNVLYHQPLTLLKYLFPNLRKGVLDPHMTNGLLDMGIAKNKFQFVDHHRAHVAAAFAMSKFEDCIGISYGGFAPHLSGTNVSGAVYRCRENHMEFLQDIPLPATGCYYSGISVALGFNYMQQENIVTALSAFGDPSACEKEVNLLTTHFVRDRWIPYEYWVDYILSPRRQAFLASHSGRRLMQLCQIFGRENVAAAAQKAWQENNLNLIRYLGKKYKCNRFVVAGGVYNNLPLTRKIRECIGVKNLFVHPFPGDGSTPIGAALEAHQQRTGQTLRLDLQDLALGVEFMDSQLKSELDNYSDRIAFHKSNDSPLQAARALAHGEIVAWFQGREEYGPLPMGHRCILADPRRMEFRDCINRIKQRASFIPIAAACLRERGNGYFNNFTHNPFMTQIVQVRKTKAHLIPGALHIDMTALVQSVTPESNMPFRKIVEYFYNLTNIPLILNSSLNFHGRPTVHRPSEALDMFLKTDIDKLFIGSFVVKKRQK